MTIVKVEQMRVSVHSHLLTLDDRRGILREEGFASCGWDGEPFMPNGECTAVKNSA